MSRLVSFRGLALLSMVPLEIRMCGDGVPLFDRSRFMGGLELLLFDAGVSRVDGESLE